MKLNDTIVPGINHKVELSGQIETADLTGTASATDRAYRGWKAKIVQVTLEIPMEDTRPPDARETDGERLRYGEPAATLMRGLFEAADEGGSPVLYDVNDPTCQAWGVFKARFHERLSVKENQDKRKWDVVFTLKEERSIPERSEERQPDAAKVEVPKFNGAIEGFLGKLEPIAGKLLSYLGADTKP